MQFNLIFDFLNEAESKMKSYKPLPDEEDNDREGMVKDWWGDVFRQPIDIRHAHADLKKFVLTIGVEAGVTGIQRGDFDKNYPNPDEDCPRTLYSIPESARDLFKDIYENGMEIVRIIEANEKFGKRARV